MDRFSAARRSIVGLVWLLTIITWSTTNAAGAETAAPTVTAEDVVKDLTAKRAQVAEQIAKLTKDKESAAPSLALDDTSDAKEEVDDELDLLRSLDLVYVQHLAAIEQLSELEQDQKWLKEEVETFHSVGLPGSKPYSFLLLEDFRDHLTTEKDRAKTFDADLDVAKQMLSAALEAFDSCERERLTVKEAAGENKDPNQKSKLARELQMAITASTSAQATIELRKAEIKVKNLRQEVSKTRRDLYEEKIAHIGKDIRYSEADFKLRIKDLEKVEQETQSQLARAKVKLQACMAQQTQTLAKLTKENSDQKIVEEATKTFRSAIRTRNEVIRSLTHRIAHLKHFKHLVGLRYEMLNGSSSPERLTEWQSVLEDTLDQLATAEKRLSLRLEDVREEQSTLYGQSHDVTQQLKPALDAKDTALDRLAQACEDGLLQTKAAQRWSKRFFDDLKAANFAVAKADLVGYAREKITEFWEYPLGQANDQPITFGKLVTALSVMLVGVLISRLLSWVIARHLLSRFGIGEGAIHALRSISFYTLCTLFGFFALQVGNLPFAAFTFLGGAVAIAIGFGTQNILNNFISGVILLAEQPIRIGDMVQIDSILGTVEHIGARSTRVRTMSNHEMLVPNSQILENKVTNLTLSDNLVKTAIGVTLSPTLGVDEVIRRLREAAASHPKVLANPEPVVLFLSFNNTDMAFELHFWLKIKNLMESKVVESEVRASISRSLRNTNAATTPIGPTVIPTMTPAKSVDTKDSDSRTLRKAS